MKSNYEDYRRSKIETGQLFQDFVTRYMWEKHKVAVNQFTSERYQKLVGESATGIEIKHDEKFLSTGNLWIETGEKARPRQGDYYPSGIYRNDNTRYYLIGDYDTLFLFEKKRLIEAERSGRYRTIENGTRTSIGFLLPSMPARAMAMIVLYPEASSSLPADIVERLNNGKEKQMELLRSNKPPRGLFDYN